MPSLRPLAPPAPPGVLAPDASPAAAPPPPPPPPQALPDHPETIIRTIAQAQGLDPDFVLSIAQTESGLNPHTKPSSKGAIGLMQLMPATAAEYGVNADDPYDNVLGGVKKLRSLYDAHNGDLEQMARRYNGSGPETDDYAYKVLTEYERRKGLTPGTLTSNLHRTSTMIGAGDKTPPAAGVAAAGPEPSASTALTNVGGLLNAAAAHTGQSRARGEPSAGALFHNLAGLYDVTRHGLDPHTREGRRNLAATAAAAATAWTGVPEAAGASWLVGALTSAMASGAGGATAETAEQAVERLRGQRPAMAPAEIVDAGLETAAQDAIGHASLVAPRAVGRAVMGKNIAADVAQAMGAERTALRTFFQDKIDTLSQAARDLKFRFGTDKAARTVASETAVAAAQRRAEEALAHGQQSTSRTLTATRAQGTEAVDAAKAAADAARWRGQIGYQQDIGLPPSETHAGAQAITALEKPAKAELKALGEQVEGAVATGPRQDISAIQKEAQRIVEEELLPAERGLPQERSTTRRTLDPALDLAITQEERAALAKSPVMRTLRRIVNADRQVDFRSLRDFATQLAEQTDFDSPVASQMDGVRKKLWGMIREQLGTHAPYDQAATVYAAARSHLTEGYAGATAKVADLEPARLIQQISPNDPLQTAKLMTLLTLHAPKAANAVRDAWLYRNVLQGGIEGLGQRLNVLYDRPEFARNLFGERLPPTLRRYSDVAAAWDALKKSGEEAVTRTARTAAEDLLTAKERAAQRMQRIGQAGKTVIEDTQQAGKDTARATQASYEQARKAALDEMAANRIGKRASRVITDQEALALSHTSKQAQQILDGFSAVVAPNSFRGAIGLVRSLTGPRSGDLLKIAAGRPEVNQALVAWLANPDTKVAYHLVKRLVGQEIEEHGVRPVTGPVGPIIREVLTPPPPPPGARQATGGAPATPR